MIFCDTDGNNVQLMSLSYTPRYMTEVDKNTKAVSCKFDKVILIIDISKLLVVNKIITKKRCYGILYNYNNLYVVVGKLLHVMNIQGKVLSSLPCPLSSISSSTNYINITANRDRLYCVNSNAVYCSSLDGRLILKFENKKYESLRRVTTDDSGHVFVTDEETKTVLTVSGDGKHQEIFKESDEIKKP
ncbi:Hypothetical predicted protein, partial [Mytilus galloprovincialis]